MQNYDKVLEYTNKTMEASGTSAQKYTHYMSSLEAKINELTVQWEQFIQGLNQSGTIKIGVSLLSGLLSVLDALTNKVPVLQGVLTTILSFKVANGVIKSVIPNVVNMGNSFSKLAKKIKAFKLGSLNKAFKQFDSILLSGNKTMSTYEKWQTALVISNKKLNQEQKISALTGMGFTEVQATQLVMNKNLAITIDEMVAKYGMNDAALIRSTLLTGNLTEAEKVQRLAQQMKMSAQLKGIIITDEQATADAELVVQNYAVGASGEVAAAGMSMLNLVLAGLMVVATGVIAVVTALNQQAEQARESAIDAGNAYKEQSDSMQELMDKYKDLRKELSQTQDLDAQKEITSQIIDIRNEVIETYGSEAAEIDFINGKLDTTLEKWNQIKQAQAEQTYGKSAAEIRKAVEYSQSSGLWSFMDYARGGTYGATVNPNRANMLNRYSEDIKDILDSLDLKNFEKYYVGIEGMAATYTFGFSSKDAFTTFDSMNDALTKISELLLTNNNLTDAQRQGLERYQTELSDTIKTIEADANFTQNRELFELGKQWILDAMKPFVSENTGEVVNPSVLTDDLSNVITQLNALSGLQDITSEENIEKFKTLELDATKYQGYLQEVLDQTSDEASRALIENIISELNSSYAEAQQKVLAKQTIETVIKTGDWGDKIAKLTKDELINAATSGDTLDELFNQIQESLPEGIVMSIDDIITAIDELGLSYQKTETITATDLIAGFPTDAKQITNAVDNIEKLNNAIKALSEGTTPDIEELFELKTADVDITNLTQGGLDNIAKIEAVRNDYVQSMLDTLDEQLAINNATMAKQKDITDEQRLEITNQNKLLELEKQIISNAVDGVKTTANEYVTAIKSAGELIAEVAGYGDSTISEDILSSMVDQYSGMASIVEKYRLGMIDNDELLKAFKQFYNNDIDNFYDYQQKKYMESNQYYSDWLDKNSDFVEEFKAQYGIDLKNAQNYAEAKALILGNMSKYIDANGELTEEGEYSTTHINSPSDVEWANKIKATQKRIKELIANFDEHPLGISIDIDDSQLDIITSRMKEAYSLIHELGQESSQITLDTLDSMKSAYPAMTEYIDKYLRKEMTRQELISKFKELYEQDKTNYKNAQIEKLYNDKSFYSTLLANNDNWVKEFKKDYDIDLKNFKTLTEAKKVIQQMFEDESTDNIIDIFSYVDEKTGEYTSDYYALLSGEHIPTGGYWFVPYVQMLHDLISEAQDDLNNAAEQTVDTIEDLITGAVYSVEDALSDVSTVLSKQVEYYEDIANGIVAAAQLEIDALDKEIDLLDKKNEAQQRQIALQEKLEALNKAKTQRSVREYNAETGQFEWTTNKKDIKKAQEEYDQQLTENQKQALEDEKEWYEKYGESFSSVPETIQNQRDIQSALNWLAQYRGVDVSTLTSKDLLSLSEKEQSAFRSAYGRAVDTNLGFEEAQSQKETRKAQTNLVSGGYATNGKTGFAFNWEAITNALGSSITTLASTLDKYTEILKPTSFAETKPTTNAVTNITNTGEVKNSYTFTGDMEFKFDKDVDADNFISKFVSKLQMQNGITTVK